MELLRIPCRFVDIYLQNSLGGGGRHFLGYHHCPQRLVFLPEFLLLPSLLPASQVFIYTH